MENNQLLLLTAPDEARQQRAQRILEANGVQLQDLTQRVFTVTSERKNADGYTVNLMQGTCTCMDATALYNVRQELVKPAFFCKHLLAANTFERYILEAKAEAKAPARMARGYAVLFEKRK